MHCAGLLSLFLSVKDLERENARLRKAISDMALDKQILEEALSVKF